MHKIWFYIALLSLLIGGVYFSLPSEAEREQMKIAAQKRQAEKQAKMKAAQSSPNAASQAVSAQAASTP